MDIDKLKNILIYEKNNKIKDSLYHYSQVIFAYNSNKIEGSKLTEEETEAIFNDKRITSKNSDDIIEAQNHFKLFDFILDNIDELLSKEMIIRMNVILKNNTSDAKNPKYNVGGFKTVPNIIGVFNVINTSSPEDCENDLDDLLRIYNKKEKITLDDIIDFHVAFERIHPFGDGNGRVGRIIMFKECLKNNIMPFIILDEDRPYYMRGLKEYNRDRAYLIDTIKKEIDYYENVYKYFKCEKVGE